MTGRQLSPRLMRQLLEHEAVAPAKPSVLHPVKRRMTRKMHDEIVAAEWPHHRARLEAADAKRARRRQRNRLAGR
jgi:hypothetical protein